MIRNTWWWRDGSKHKNWLRGQTMVSRGGSISISIVKQSWGWDLCLHDFKHTEQAPLCSAASVMHLDSEARVSLIALLSPSSIFPRQKSWSILDLRLILSIIPSLTPVPCKMLCEKWTYFLKYVMLCFMFLFLDSFAAPSFHWNDPLTLILAWTVAKLPYSWRLLWMTSQASYLNVFNKEIKITRPFPMYSAAGMFQWYNIWNCLRTKSVKEFEKSISLIQQQHFIYFSLPSWNFIHNIFCLMSVLYTMLYYSCYYNFVRFGFSPLVMSLLLGKFFFSFHYFLFF